MVDSECTHHVHSAYCVMYDRYTLLVGNPPFVGSTLKEVFSRIRKNDFHVPPQQVSEDAKSLIVRLLHPDPTQRPKPAEILQDRFFTQGNCPKRLPVTVLSVAPRFSLSMAGMCAETSFLSSKTCTSICVDIWLSTIIITLVLVRESTLLCITQLTFGII